MKKYRVTWEMDVEVSAEDKFEAVEKAISRVCGQSCWFQNELTNIVEDEALVEEIEEEDEEDY